MIKKTVISITVFILLLSCTKQVDQTDITAPLFIPHSNANFIYMKNFKEVSKEFSKTELAKRIEKNYIYLDFKYQTFQNIKFFFIELNLDMQKLLKFVTKDFLVGQWNKNHFIVASIDYKAKLVYSILNILPETKVNETDIKDEKVSVVKKGKSTVYFTVIHDYLLVTNHSKTMEELISSVKNREKSINSNLYEQMEDTELHIRTDILQENNFYKLLPGIEEFSLTIDLMDNTAKIGGFPGKEAKLEYSEDDKPDFQLLKLLSKELALYYYNRDYNYSQMITNLLNSRSLDVSNRSKLQGFISQCENFKHFKQGISLFINQLSLEKRNDMIRPEVCFSIELDKTLADNQKTEVINGINQVFGYLLGVGNWQKQNKNQYQQFTNNINDFSIIIFKQHYIISSSRKFSDAMVEKIENPQVSLYDSLYSHVSATDQFLTYYSYINFKTLAANLDPVMSQYIYQNLSYSDNEYENSFGDLFSYFQKLSPLYMEISYQEQSKMFTGKTIYVK